MEIVVSNELLDIVRVDYGLLLRVEKFDHPYDYKTLIPKDYIDKKDLKKVGGASMGNFKETKKDIMSPEGELVLSKGEFVYRFSSYDDYTVIKPLTDPKRFYFSVKCSGGTIEGRGSICIDKLMKIQSIVNERYGI